MLNFERMKKALKKREEENYAKLQDEVKKLRDNIEHFFTLFFESTTSEAHTRYTTLGMY